MRNLNLLKKEEFIEFANIFDKNGKSVLDKMFKKTSIWPDYDKSTDDRIYKEQLDKWNITFSPGGFLSSYGDISYIRLSYLVDIIKEIVGHDKCKMNIIDYSCSPISHFVSDAERINARYMQPMDIENAKSKFGGKNARNKRRTYRRFAKKRYTKKRHRKNKASKTSNNPIQKKQHKNT
jgi:hypothetical protein